MEVRYLEEPFPHVIVDNVWDEDTLSKINKELTAYLINGMMLPGDKAGGARDENNNPKRYNLGMFLEDVYSSDTIETSTLFNKTRDYFFNEQIREATDKHWGLRPFNHAEEYKTKLAYYRDGDYYKPHRDKSYVTILTHVFDENKFTGGDLVFPEFQYVLPPVNNRVIIFNSTIVHGVSQVNTKEYQTGRWSITQFIIGVK